MKNRKLLIAAFLCFAMIITGVGYAAISGHLKINGTAAYNKVAAETGFIENIVFSNATIDENSGGSARNEQNTDAATAEGQEATFSVRTLAVQDEYVIFTYDLTNNNVVDANITIKVQHDDSTANPSTTFSLYRVDFVKVDNVTMYDGTLDTGKVQEAASFVLGSTETTTVTVKVSLTNTPSTNITTEDFRLHLTATSVDE